MTQDEAKMGPMVTKSNQGAGLRRPILPQTGHVEWGFIQIFPFDLKGAIAPAPGRMGSRMGVEWHDTPSKSNGKANICSVSAADICPVLFPKSGRQDHRASLSKTGINPGLITLPVYVQCQPKCFLYSELPVSDNELFSQEPQH